MKRPRDPFAKRGSARLPGSRPAHAASVPAQLYAYLIDIGGSLVKVDLVTAKVIYSLTIPDSILGTDSLASWDQRPGKGK